MGKGLPQSCLFFAPFGHCILQVHPSLRCVALRCVALRCVAYHTHSQKIAGVDPFTDQISNTKHQTPNNSLWIVRSFVRSIFGRRSNNRSVMETERTICFAIDETRAALAQGIAGAPRYFSPRFEIPLPRLCPTINHPCAHPFTRPTIHPSIHPSICPPLPCGWMLVVLFGRTSSEVIALII